MLYLSVAIVVVAALAFAAFYLALKDRKATLSQDLEQSVTQRLDHLETRLLELQESQDSQDKELKAVHSFFQRRRVEDQVRTPRRKITGVS